MSEPLKVFVNGKGYALPKGSTVIDAIAAADAAAADEVRAGTRGVVDSRGVGVANDFVLTGGFVMRVVSARAAREGVDA
jgi:hypothetical protein